MYVGIAEVMVHSSQLLSGWTTVGIARAGWEEMVGGDLLGDVDDRWRGLQKLAEGVARLATNSLSGFAACAAAPPAALHSLLLLFVYSCLHA